MSVDPTACEKLASHEGMRGKNETSIRISGAAERYEVRINSFEVSKRRKPISNTGMFNSNWWKSRHNCDLIIDCRYPFAGDLTEETIKKTNALATEHSAARILEGGRNQMWP
jgi:hypothetical protein